MTHLHPIFETILKTHNFASGRKRHGAKRHNRIMAYRGAREWHVEASIVLAKKTSPRAF